MAVTDVEYQSTAWSDALQDELARQMALAYVELIRADLREITRGLDVLATEIIELRRCTG